MFLRIRGRIGAIILLSKKNCEIPYSFLRSLLKIMISMLLPARLDLKIVLY
jgi:hypothetical protein